MDQIGEWVPACFGTEDDVKLAALAVSEPNAGSDVSSMKTTAVYDEAKDEWVLNGVKTWITNGGIADVHVVVAAVDPALKARGQASFVVGPDFKGKGLSQGQKFKKHGIRASHTSEVILDDLRLPGSALLGEKAKLDERLARARERAAALARGEQVQSSRQKGGQAAMATFEASRPGRRRAGRRHRPGRLRVRARLRQDPRAVRPPDHPEPGHRVHARRHEDEGGRRRLLTWRAAWMGKNNIAFTSARAR
jgi:hypothetical protein